MHKIEMLIYAGSRRNTAKERAEKNFRDFCASWCAARIAERSAEKDFRDVCEHRHTTWISAKVGSPRGCFIEDGAKRFARTAVTLRLARLRGTSDRARTCDPRLRRPMLYPTELRTHRRMRTVGAKGFEPSTSSSQSWRATRLRYAPKRLRHNTLIQPDRQDWKCASERGRMEAWREGRFPFLAGGSIRAVRVPALSRLLGFGFTRIVDVFDVGVPLAGTCPRIRPQITLIAPFFVVQKRDNFCLASGQYLAEFQKRKIMFNDFNRLYSAMSCTDIFSRASNAPRPVLRPAAPG